MDLLKDPHTLLIVIGAVFLLIGLLGGGLEISAIRIPTVGKYPRLLLGVLGVLFVVGGLLPAISPKSSEPPKPATPTPSAIAAVNTPTIPLAQPSAASGQPITSTAVPVNTVGLDRSAAQRVALEWVGALNKRDVGSAIDLASLPFLWPQEDIIRSGDSLRMLYAKMFSETAASNAVFISMVSVETRTLGEWRAESLHLPEEKSLKNVELGDVDFGTRIYARLWGNRDETLLIYVRQLKGVPKVAGLWIEGKK
jgi:hypothetical protein